MIEFKPTWLWVFREYLLKRRFTHATYTDLDVVFGDLDMWLDPAFILPTDITTWAFRLVVVEYTAAASCYFLLLLVPPPPLLFLLLAAACAWVLGGVRLRARDFQRVDPCTGARGSCRTWWPHSSPRAVPVSAAAPSIR